MQKNFNRADLTNTHIRNVEIIGKPICAHCGIDIEPNGPTYLYCGTLYTDVLCPVCGIMQKSKAMHQGLRVAKCNTCQRDVFEHGSDCICQ